MTTERRLSDSPDFIYLLREFHDAYRKGRAGGSASIRAHQSRVREAVNRLLEGNVPMVDQEVQSKPVTGHLKRALDNGRRETTGSMVRSIESVLTSLNWQYGYEKMPRGLAQKYAFAQFAGPTGPIHSVEVTLGVVLFGPKCIYPAHAHDEVTESYIVLSGTVSENDYGVYAPGSLIFNPPGRMHRITVSDTEPALLAYAWHGPREKLTNQKMTFKRVERKEK
ncbi:cupin domain-containing protein [Rhodobacteraceae bacterium NNCM2]|nr:cupin domain-containing protein [Coraliihabitans acroporae]